MSDKSSAGGGDIFDDEDNIESDGQNARNLGQNFLSDKDLLSLNT